MVFLLFLRLVVLLRPAHSIKDRCTALAIGCSALSRGRCGAGQSSDTEGQQDFRLIRVPGKQYPVGARRPVYDSNDKFPRFQDPDKSPGYNLRGFPKSVPIGYIPQIEETYTYFDGGYGLQNEHGVSIGESTCSARLFTKPIHQGGFALFWVGELVRLALERCKTARCAVETAGSLAVKYGFYAEPDAECGGEALTFADTTEAWVFHILADDTSKSAIWAAQRVPDGEVAVVANMFTIRTMDLTDTANFLGSPNVQSVARKLGWWSENEPFDFTKAYSAGEYTSPFYSARRMWRVYQILNPEINIDASVPLRVDQPTYPVSVKPQKPLEMKEIFAIYRDHYEGTPYDLTKGLAAGPFGNPQRWDTPASEGFGAWERAIGLYRTIYITLGIVSPTEKPVLWYSVGRAEATLFHPVRFEAEVPRSLGVGNNWEVDDDSFFWSTRNVANMLDIKFQPVLQDVQAVQREWEQKATKAVDNNEDLVAHVNGAKRRWDQLYRDLAVKYQNGYVLDPKTRTVEKPGYPAEWLNRVGYNHFAATKEDFERQRATLANAQAIGEKLLAKQELDTVEVFA